MFLGPNLRPRRQSPPQFIYWGEVQVSPAAPVCSVSESLQVYWLGPLLGAVVGWLVYSLATWQFCHSTVPAETQTQKEPLQNGVKPEEQTELMEVISSA